MGNGALPGKLEQIMNNANVSKKDRYIVTAALIAAFYAVQ
jgi:hypothetical protein